MVLTFKKKMKSMKTTEQYHVLRYFKTVKFILMQIKLLVVVVLSCGVVYILQLLLYYCIS